MVQHGESDGRTRPRSLGSTFALIWVGGWGVFTLAMVVAAIGGSDPAGVAAGVGALMAGAGTVPLHPRIGGGKPLRPGSAPLARVGRGRRGRLPRTGSAAYEPMRQLAGAEPALAELLRQLKDSAVPADTVDQAWRTATATAAGLRAAAAKLEAVEVAVEQLSPPARTTLEDGARDLRAHIEQGLDGYRDLIAAAGRALLASTPTPHGELAEETERLAGIAEALQELSGPR